VVPDDFRDDERQDLLGELGVATESLGQLVQQPDLLLLESRVV
jgi:hypothetical protein